MKKLKIAFIMANVRHYRLNLFTRLSESCNIEFLIYGKQFYSSEENLLKEANLNYKLIPHLYITKSNPIAPLLAYYIYEGNYDIIIIDNSSIACNLPIVFFTTKLLRKKFILFSEIWMNPPTFYHQLTFPLRKFIYKYSDAIIGCGDHIKRYLVDLRINEDKIFVAYNTLNNEFFNKPVDEVEKQRLKNKLNIKDKFVILFVGRLVEVKGIEYLIKAFSELEKKYNAALLIIGQGDRKSKLMREAEKLRLKNIQFLDFIPYNELYKYYSIADVFVLPSITTRLIKETWGFVINEAMNQGCPVVASDAVGAAMGGLVENRKTGIIVPERNSGVMADAISEIYSNKNFQEELRRNTLDKIKYWNEELQVKGFIEAFNFIFSPVY